MRRNWGRVAVLAVTGALLVCGCASSPERQQEREKQTKLAESRRNVGVDYLAKGRNAMAIRELRNALALDPDDPVALHALGEAYRRRGLLDEAYEKMTRALELKPDGHEIRLNLCGLLVQQEKFEEAIKQGRILVDDPTFPAPWQALTNIGWAQLKLGRRAEARQSFQDALDFRPGYWPARLDLGILDRMEGRPLEAITNFEQVLERELGKDVTAEANYRLGEVYVSLGRHEKAVEHFRVAAESAPYGPWGRQSEDYLKLLH